MRNMSTRRFLISFLRKYMSTLKTVTGSGIVIRCLSNLSRQEAPPELWHVLHILSGMKKLPDTRLRLLVVFRLVHFALTKY
jgi:hypothetical protein